MAVPRARCGLKPQRRRSLGQDRTQPSYAQFCGFLYHPIGGLAFQGREQQPQIGPCLLLAYMHLDPQHQRASIAGSLQTRAPSTRDAIEDGHRIAKA